MSDRNARHPRPIKRVQGFSKASPLGTRKSREGEEPRRLWLRRSVGLLCLVCALGLAAYFVAEPLTRLVERPLASVMVEGEFRFISKARAMQLISAEINDEFLQLDLMHLKTVLESEPWIERATLIRRWPDALVVKITEQQPIARWGAEGFLNQSGEIIKVKDVALLDDLPLLQGEETDAGRIMQQYQDLSQLLRSRGLEVSALQCDSKKAWKLTLNGEVNIAIGRDQVMEKMQRFVTIYDELLSKVWSDVVSIDVRYTNGVAVQWRPDSDAEKKYIKTM